MKADSFLTKFLIAVSIFVFIASIYQELQDKQTVPKIVQLLLYDFPDHNWKGFIALFIDWIEHKEALKSELFTKIYDGEVWRLLTPAFLHGGLLHLLFNMLWLFLLGKLIEKNISFYAYLFFIVVVGVITNTLQYLMTGPYFMGFSGIVSGMAGYIWVRKKRAPWEMYPIDFTTLYFLGIFILGMLALQIVAFFLHILHIVSFQLNIANTAHVSGALLGMIFGRVEVFQRKL